MTKMGCLKLAGLVAASVLFHLLTVLAQPGFLSISCGGTTNHTAENNITWFADTNYIEVGETADIGNVTYKGSYFHSLRHFPKPLKKSCYHLPVIPNVPYLVRLGFAVGNYTGLQNMSTYGFAFSIETPGMLFVQKIPTINLIIYKYPFYLEEVLVSSGRVLYICLIRTTENNDPFISSIELRSLRDGMYQQAKPGTLLSLLLRYDIGANSSVRYPQDEFDRLWEATASLQLDGIQSVSVQEPISTTNTTQDLPPSVVMQTAWISNYNSLSLAIPLGVDSTKLLLFYFADIEPVNMTFNVSINSQVPNAITMAGNYSALQTAFVVNDSNLDVELSTPTNSTSRPFLNAVEIYSLIHTQPATYSKDIEALEALRVTFGMKDWISDPCYLIPWKGICCNNNSSTSSVVRISEINLSASNLLGLVPENIAELTALVNLSLEDNHLTGPLPNFSSLVTLKRLHLQNNNLTGTVPDWLCGLKNLQELFIENNNFSGVIPACLLKPSLNFSYSVGNRYLQLPSIPGKDRLRLILSITFSGSLVIGLVSIIIIVMRCKKFKRKESSSVENSKHLVDEDSSVVIVPSTTKSRAFTLEEITEATQNFTQKIGQGGFGSVFLGKLQQRIDVAVKVLSLDSKQGVREFVNEVDLLSKVHHKNLVSLLGYCNESKELMLVYEHMSRGSLTEHLYGPSAEFSHLNWKTRLKIASDAAQGLEYLHVGCIPKIIHRDVKTTNILIDKNFNGKLSDFGLSRMTIDEEVSHVTTKVKGTFGYMDPEYLSTKKLTDKSDVYSFGVVLLEIICGRKPINLNLPEEELNLAQWVTQYAEMDEIPGKIEEIIDKRLDRSYGVKSITCVAKLAIRCVQDEPSSRPSVTEVVAELKEAIKLENNSASLNFGD